MNCELSEHNSEEMINRAVELFKTLELTELTLRDGDFAIELKKQPPVAASMPVLTAAPAASAAGPAASAQTEQPAIQPLCEQPMAAAAKACGVAVKAPLLGVFYAASSPDAQPFVKVGDQVKKGDILCILEAMKMMNEIVAEEDGTISEICAENGKIVEFGQILFKMTK